LTSRVTCMAFAPTAQMFASGAEDGRIILWQVREEKGGTASEMIDTLKAGLGRITSLAFSPDGETLISGTARGHLQVWAAWDGALRCTLTAHTGAVRHIAFAPDGQTLYTAGDDETLSTWTIMEESADPEEMLLPETSLSFTPPLSCLTWLGKRDDLAAGSAEGSLILWTQAAPRPEEGLAVSVPPTFHLPAHDGALVTMAASEDGGMLLTGSLDTSAALWQMQPGDEPPAMYASLAEHGAAVRAASFAPDGRRLAVGTQAGAVWLWSLPDETGNWQSAPALLVQQASVLWGLSFSPDWRRLAAACYDNRVLLWRLHADAEAGYICDEPPLALHGHTAAVQSVAFSANGKLLASAAHDNIARLWPLGDANEEDARPEVEPVLLQGHTGSVTALDFSPCGRIVATGAVDTTVRLWHAADGALLRTLKGHTATVTGVAFSHSGSLVASASADGTVRLWGLTHLLAQAANDTQAGSG
jgi:WD40 repeat protein